MRKGKNTIVKTVAASALTAALAVSMGATAAFAATGEFGENIGNVKAEETAAFASSGVTLNASYKVTVAGQGDASAITNTITGDLTGTTTPITVNTDALFSEANITAIKNLGVGTYTFKVTNNFTAANASIAQDNTEYYVLVQVKNNGSGTENNYYVASTVAHKESADGDKSEIKFGTKYTKYANVDEDDPGDGLGDVSKGLTISKTVTGDDANYTDTFEYTIKFTKDSVNEGLDLYTDSEIKQGEATVDKDDDNHYNLDYDKEYIFTLQNGDSINFTVPAGTTYTVEETDTKNYTPSVTFVENGTEGDATKISSDKKKVDGAVAGEKANKVEFTNTKSSDVLTGVLTENAPFIAMVVAAAFALVGYVVYKRRRTN